jgi:apolipoprotein N-acyltransferase
MLSLQGRSPLTAFGLGWLYGLVAVYGICGWLFQVPAFCWYHGLLLAVYLALYPAVWASTTALLSTQNGGFCYCFLPPALWVVLDYLKAHAGFLAFPWATLDLSQHSMLPLLQLASISGGYGITFIIVLINSAVAYMILTRNGKPLLGLLLVVGVLAGWGKTRLDHPHRGGRRLTVAALQPVIPPRKDSEKSDSETVLRPLLARLTKQAVHQGARLVVWPETALGNFNNHPQTRHWLSRLAAANHCCILTGVSEYDKFQSRNENSGKENGPRIRCYNSACFVTANGDIAPLYHKQRLLPFGEYLPLPSIIHWPRWLISPFIECVAGRKNQLFPLTNGDYLAPVICWENMFAGLVRSAVLAGASLIVHITNDRIFGKTPITAQHNLASVMRAVENRVPVVISSNTGPSEIIDAYGRVIAKTPELFTKGFALGRITCGGNERTWYSRIGDGFVLVCCTLLALFLFFRLERADIGRPSAG